MARRQQHLTPRMKQSWSESSKLKVTRVAIVVAVYVNAKLLEVVLALHLRDPSLDLHERACRA
jgi:hypothetical protein